MNRVKFTAPREVRLGGTTIPAGGTVAEVRFPEEVNLSPQRIVSELTRGRFLVSAPEKVKGRKPATPAADSEPDADAGSGA
jgi:hypothetical protein